MIEITLKDLRDTISLVMNPEPVKQLSFVFPKSLVEAYGIENTKEMISNRYGGTYEAKSNGVQYVFTEVEKCEK